MGKPSQGASVPNSAAINYDRLFVRGIEINPESFGATATASSPAAEMEKLDHIKRINTAGEINVSLLAKSFNLLLDELEDKGYMKKR